MVDVVNQKFKALFFKGFNAAVQKVGGDVFANSF